MSIGASVFIGTFASLVSNVAVSIKSRSGVDDTLDVFPCHGLGGLFGMIMTGVFALDGGLITGETRIFLVHLAASVGVIVFVLTGSWLLYKATDAIIPMRVPEEQEDIGLDASQHGESVDSMPGNGTAIGDMSTQTA